MSKIIKVAAVLFIIVVIILWITPSTMPDLPELYSLKRVEEKIILTLKSNPSDKVTYEKTLLNNRLEELTYISHNKNYDLILTCSLRYAATAGQLTQYLLSNNMKNETVSTVQFFKQQQKAINKLYAGKDSNDNWKFVHDDFNYLTIYSQKLLHTKTSA